MGFTLSLVSLEALNEVFLLLSHRFSLHFVEFVSEAQTALKEFFKMISGSEALGERSPRNGMIHLLQISKQSLLAESYTTMKVDKISLFFMVCLPCFSLSNFT